MRLLCVEGLELKGKRDEAGEGTITLWFFERRVNVRKEGEGSSCSAGAIDGGHAFVYAFVSKM